MRKRYKKKKLTCGLCKPHKLNGAKRWDDRELESRKEYEKEVQNINKNDCCVGRKRGAEILLSMARQATQEKAKGPARLSKNIDKYLYGNNL